MLATGASIQITLAADGGTTGRMVIPGDGVDADLTGSWSLKNDRVSLSHRADTFLRDVDFVAAVWPKGATLDGLATFNGTKVAVTLVRE